MLVLVVGGTGLSLLLWGRLRLITNVPRTVYAQPEQASDPSDTEPVAEDPSIDSDGNGSEAAEGG